MIRSFVDGVLAVLIAVVVGTAIAVGLAQLGLTDTSWLRLGPWLAGLGLLGGWQQQVTSDIAGGISWATTVTGAPLLVTGAVWLFVSRRARAGTWVSALPGALGAAVAAAALTLVTTSSATVTNAAGSVTTRQGLSWAWENNHPGTVVGAALLVGLVWLLNTVGLPWWRWGRGVALSLLAGLGAVLTLVVAGGVYYLTSSTAVAVALGALYPLAGTLLLFGLAGAPVSAGLTRLTPEVLALNTWSESLLYGVGGLVAAVLLAALVGLVMRLFKHRSTWLGAGTVTAALAAFLAWATGTQVAVPESLGAVSVMAVNPLVAAAVGAGLGLVTRFTAGRPKDAPGRAAPAAASPDADVEALLREVQAGPSNPTP
jgi:hypothetical protein